MKLDKRKILIGAMCFVTIGLLSDRLIGRLSVFIVPFVFGLILPFVNWRDLGQKKVMKLTFVTLTSLVLFYLSFFAAMTLGINSLVVVSIICGLAGVGLYVTTSVFINSLEKGVIQLGLIFILGAISIPVADLLTKIIAGDNTPSDFFFPTWTILVGLAMSLGQRVSRKTEDELTDRQQSLG
jgi:hypothetical protein